MFLLDERLKNDTIEVANLDLCKVLLMNNKDFLWIILVPQKENLKELIDLNFDEQIILLQEINLISKILQDNFKPDKLNIATLGNIVNQLHFHIIARYKNDKIFPKPVWGVECEKYQENEALKLIKILQENVAKK